MRTAKKINYVYGLFSVQYKASLLPGPKRARALTAPPSKDNVYIVSLSLRVHFIVPNIVRCRLKSGDAA